MDIFTDIVDTRRVQGRSVFPHPFYVALERARGLLAQQPFQPGTVVCLDAHPGIDRETAAVFPGGHDMRLISYQ